MPVPQGRGGQWLTPLLNPGRGVCTVLRPSRASPGCKGLRLTVVSPAVRRGLEAQTPARGQAASGTKLGEGGDEDKAPLPALSLQSYRSAGPQQSQPVPADGDGGGWCAVSDTEARQAFPRAETPGAGPPPTTRLKMGLCSTLAEDTPRPGPHQPCDDEP